MKLRYSPTSPYVRKVRVTAIEAGLDQAIELVLTNPWDPKGDIERDNPLGKVPALILDDGEVLYDSPVICEYLDSLREGPALIPAQGMERWRQLRLQALADGVLDAAVLIFLETSRRDPASRSAWWLEVQHRTLQQAVREMEGDAGRFRPQPDIGQIAAACALGYLDFRIVAYDWRKQAPALAVWYRRFEQRPSMQETVPRDPS